MGCIVPSGCIHTCDCLNYCDYNAIHSYANSSRNSSRLKNRRCELSLSGNPTRNKYDVILICGNGLEFNCSVGDLFCCVIMASAFSDRRHCILMPLIDKSKIRPRSICGLRKQVSVGSVSARQQVYAKVENQSLSKCHESVRSESKMFQ